MKKLVFLLSILILVPIASARLVDNTNYAIPQNSQKCFDLSIPEDFGVIDTRVTFSISSNCGDWCDFSKSLLTTDRTNPVIIPICLTSKDKKSGDRKTFSVDISTQGKKKTYNFGACVHDNADKDVGSGDPCGITNIKQDNFDITVNPDPIYVESGKSKTYEIHITSQERFKVEVESSTGRKWNVETNPKNANGAVVTDNVGSDKTEIAITARITNSQVPGDTKTITVPVYLSADPPPGDFAIFLSKENTNTLVNDPVNYELEIENFGDSKEYTIQVQVPNWFKSDISNLTRTISGKEKVNIQITPTQAISSDFRIIVSTSGGEKTKAPFISVNEIQSDIGRTLQTENPPSKVRRCMSQQNVANRGKSIGDQVDSWGSFLDCTEEPETGTSPGSPGTQGTGLNPAFIIIPIVVIAGAVFYYFYKKKKPVEEDQEEQY